MTIKSVEVHVKFDEGEPKVYQLRQTQEAAETKAGKTTKAIWQPEDNNKVLMHYGKVYIDTTAKS